MAKSIILEWDSQRVRVAVGSPSSTSPSVTRVADFAIDQGEEPDEPVTIAESIAAGLSREQVGRGDTVVLVDRAAAELRVLFVPDVPADELPAVVKFQVGREFASVADGWLVDYVSLPALPNGQRRVLAGAISPQVAAQIRGCCEKAKLDLKQVVLRPFAVGRFLKLAGQLNQTTMVLEVFSTFAELSVFHEGELQLTRSVRVAKSSGGEALARQLLSETKRTLNAFQNQQRDAPVARLLLAASEDVRPELASRLQGAFEFGCVPIDPWQLMSETGSIKAEPAEHAEQFLALFGGLCQRDPATAEIDFVNPTQPPPPPSNKRRNIFIGATVGTLALSLFLLYYTQMSILDQRVRNLQTEIAAMANTDTQYQQKIQEVEMIDRWELNNVSWLAELSTISRQFPMPDDAVVDDMTMEVVAANDEAKVTLSGRVAQPTGIKDLESRLMDPEKGRAVIGKINTPVASGELYRWKFDETLKIDLVKALEAAQQVATEASEAETTDAETTDSESGVVGEDSETEDSETLDSETDVGGEFGLDEEGVSETDVSDDADRSEDADSSEDAEADSGEPTDVDEDSSDEGGASQDDSESAEQLEDVASQADDADETDGESDQVTEPGADSEENIDAEA